jgi:6,7-dimethyl-8-ribityllumazine synthase
VSERWGDRNDDRWPDDEDSLDAVPASAAVADEDDAEVDEVEVEIEYTPEEGEEEDDDDEPLPAAAATDHAAGEFRVPDGFLTLEGAPTGDRRSVAVVVARFNSEITTRLLERAIAELEEAGVSRDAITVVPVPGAFELPLAAMALAKTRRYACIVALGCVIRGETAHFEYVAGEAASGLQLAALETGVPVAFGLLTTETAEQAEARVDRAADAVRSALEMADLFHRLRVHAAAR